MFPIRNLFLWKYWLPFENQGYHTFTILIWRVKQVAGLTKLSVLRKPRKKWIENASILLRIIVALIENWENDCCEVYIAKISQIFSSKVHRQNWQKYAETIKFCTKLRFSRECWEPVYHMFFETLSIVEVREGGTDEYIFHFPWCIWVLKPVDFMSCCLLFYGGTTSSVEAYNCEVHAHCLSKSDPNHQKIQCKFNLYCIY